MADKFKMYKICPRCKGTGEISINDEPFDPGPPEIIACPKCNGAKVCLWGYIKEIEQE